MEIGNEISQKIRDAIKTKLQDLGSYVDDELPEYIMVMLANKRSNSQMNEDLTLFLGENTVKFTDWLSNLVGMLIDVTSMAVNIPIVDQPKEPVAAKPLLLKTINAESKSSQDGKPLVPRSATSESRRSPPRAAPVADGKPHAGRFLQSRIEKPKVPISMIRPLSSEVRTNRQRWLTGTDDEDNVNKPVLPSIVKVQEKRPTLPPSKQATSSLLKKAVAEAHQSVTKIAPPFSLTYDPMSPTSPIRSHTYAEKQQQKELLLQQHRELQQQLKRKEMEIKDDSVETAKLIEEEELPDQEPVTNVRTEQETQVEPMIELRVSEAEALEYSVEAGEKDTRIVAFADSQAGNDSDEEKRKRRKKRAVKSRDRPRSPKFIVTLDGVDSELEDKYDKEVKKERHKKHKKEEFDDFIEVDTSNIITTKQEEPEKLPVDHPAPPVEQVMIRLDGSDDEEMSPVKARPQDRCKFWPDCINGDSCPFYHPTVPCRAFPNCNFGDTCMFIHPQCKFDGRCTNSLCPFMHKLKNTQISPVAPPAAAAPTFPLQKTNANLPSLQQLTPCKYFPGCTRSNCPFQHPTPPAKICRYGSSCTRSDCMFSHPPSKAALKWVAPSLHISERSFAMSDENVTKMPIVS